MGDINNSDEIDCPICCEPLGDDAMVTTCCGATACSSCMTSCINRESRCFKCRQSISIQDLKPFKPTLKNALDKNLGMQFVDVSNTRGLKRVEWSKKAPQWRRASPGICLEGSCTNNNCNAYLQKVVINIGMGKFDVLTDATENVSKCPICSLYIDPDTCAFNRCMWRWSGMKCTKPGTPPSALSSDWRKADNAYHYFDAGDANSCPHQNVSGRVIWRKLILEAKTE